MLKRMVRNISSAVVAGCIVICSPLGSCIAQETEEITQPGMTMLDIIKAGGFVELVIVLLSIAAMTLIIEHFWSIRFSKLLPNDAVNAVRRMMKDRAYNDVLRVCKEKKCYFTDVLSAGLLKLRYDFSAVQDAVFDAIDKGRAALHAKIGYLAFVGTIAPMLGLLGTVTGMIRSFSNIARAAALNKPELLARGVSEALITTASGLIVAIPVMFCWFLLRDKVNRIVLEVETTVSELIEPFRPARKS